MKKHTPLHIDRQGHLYTIKYQNEELTFTTCEDTHRSIHEFKKAVQILLNRLEYNQNPEDFKITNER